MVEQSKPQIQNWTLRRRLGVGIAMAGLLIFVLGAEPARFGLDLSLSIGFLQITVFSLGLFAICLGGSVTLGALWPDGERSIAADLGLRVAWTGYVISLVSGMADIFGLGTRPLGQDVPFFGYWQSRGVLAGELLILLGFLMMIPYHRSAAVDQPDTEAPPIDLTIE